jgi:hypothetical protein
MTNQINIIRLNDSPILYTKLIPSSYSNSIGSKQYQQINKDSTPYLIETTTILGNQYRGVTIDGKFWFLVEDLVPINQNSQERLRLIEKLLTDIDNKYKSFIYVVDSRGDREYVLMVNSEGLKNKLFAH